MNHHFNRREASCKTSSHRQGNTPAHWHLLQTESSLITESAGQKHQTPPSQNLLQAVLRGTQNLTCGRKCICFVALLLIPILSIHLDFILCKYCISRFWAKTAPSGRKEKRKTDTHLQGYYLQRQIRVLQLSQHVFSPYWQGFFHFFCQNLNTSLTCLACPAQSSVLLQHPTHCFLIFRNSHRSWKTKPLLVVSH